MLTRLTIVLLLLSGPASAQTISFTFDDPIPTPTPLLTWQQRNAQLLATLDSFHLRSVLFVCGSKVDNPAGRAIVSAWDANGHGIANHSWSHWYFNARSRSFESFRDDFLRCDSVVRRYKHFVKLFRFPFLKEGDTREKRDAFRRVLDSAGYRNGYVSVDASDWYIDGEMIKALRANPKMDLTPYRDYYISHIYDRALYYDSLATLVTGRKIKHVLLLHHNLLNALFLGDLITYFKSKNWTITDATDAFTDSIYTKHPDVIPAGEGLIWALAKQTGRYDSLLRYPAEDGSYEESRLRDAVSKH